MPSFYHGSIPRYVKELVLRGGKDIRNGYRKLTRPRESRAPRPKNVEDLIGDAIAQGGKDHGRLVMDEAIAAAISDGNSVLMHDLSNALERYTEFGRAYDLRAAAQSRIADDTRPRWDGHPLPEGQLTIVPPLYDTNALSPSITYAPVMAQAARLAPGCRIFVNSRLVPLHQRSIPGAVFLDEKTIPGATGPQDGFHANLVDLLALFARSAEDIEALQLPLVADPERTATLRTKYAPNGEKVVGLAWGSSNNRKDMPRLRDWKGLLKRLPKDTVLVSLQYGDVKSATTRIASGTGFDIIFDDTIDQMSDIDSFAAQLAATDHIFTISNTSAHLAGRMGKSTTVFLDDRFRLKWPYFEDRTPWYPHTTLVHKKGRPWKQVLSETALPAWMAGT
jgi:hypothetical protein